MTPPVVVKAAAGRSQRQQGVIASEVTEAIMAAANVGEDVVSVGIKDVEPCDGGETV